MSFELPSGETTFTAIAGLLGGGVITKLIDMFTGKEGREVKTLGDTIKIMADQQERFDLRLRVAEDGLDNCHALHDACERGRREDRAEIDSLKAQIDRLVSGGLPAYHLNAPKGDPGRGEGR